MTPHWHLEALIGIIPLVIVCGFALYFAARESTRLEHEENPDVQQLDGTRRRHPHPRPRTRRGRNRLGAIVRRPKNGASS